ncbi:hypothetical protein DICPUDRAFT_84171 [Dictyostelium purpureum]|uniref:Uncharacterized protein n=1 Tax=Dictyostelium purpureum TaxID=5786 RepID=F1A1T1_DICPU|nr:uncharacterized protein DICPUDRAFT_84171 [Dictyostelium purpureum]EGC29854.1 hypothetical protein DICPUDRAFT_84171 [Dictyostelium purpureum]|eukprot:XP_003293628.1 hypothetical protein DICPUDRAFT_84171 [Dictyostelium purpureum]
MEAIMLLLQKRRTCQEQLSRSRKPTSFAMGVRIGKYYLSALIDTGCNVNLLNNKYCDGLRSIVKDIRVRYPIGDVYREDFAKKSVEATVQFKILYGKMSTEMKFYAINMEHDMVNSRMLMSMKTLGITVMKGAVVNNKTSDQVEKTDKVVSEVASSKVVPKVVDELNKDKLDAKIKEYTDWVNNSFKDFYNLGIFTNA